MTYIYLYLIYLNGLNRVLFKEEVISTTVNSGGGSWNHGQYIERQAELTTAAITPTCRRESNTSGLPPHTEPEQATPSPEPTPPSKVRKGHFFFLHSKLRARKTPHSKARGSTPGQAQPKHTSCTPLVHRWLVEEPTNNHVGTGK